MKTKKLIFFIILIITVFLLFSFQDTYTNWKRRKNIEINGENKYKSFFLDDEVYKYSSINNSDLRIVNANNQLIPFILLNGNYFKTVGKESATTARLINRSTHINKDTKQTQLYIYDFQALPDMANSKYNYIDCTIENQNYFSLVQVFGKTNNSEWNYITQDTIYNSEKFVKKTILFNYGQSYNFYRIIVKESPNKPDIKGISLISTNLNDRIKYLNKSLDLEFIQKEVGTQSIIEIKNPLTLPLYYLNINAKGNFKREYHVEDIKHENIYKTGLVYSYQNDEIKIAENKVYFHKDFIRDAGFFIIINNKNEQPLDISSITAEIYYDLIIFESDDSSQYKLLYDNQSATHPEYAIEENREILINGNNDICTLSVVSSSKEKISYSFFKLKNLLRVLLILIGLTIIFFIVVFIRAKTT